MNLSGTISEAVDTIELKDLRLAYRQFAVLTYTEPS